MHGARMLRRGGVLAAVALLAGTLAPAAQAVDAAPGSAQVFTRAADTTRKVVTLTFDADWWSPGDPTTVLRILRQNGITAGFGLTGRYVEKYPAQARALLSAGHKLINHSYDHPYFTDLTRAQRWSQLDRAEAAFNRIGHTSGGWFRAPYRDGYLDAGINRDLAARGYYISYDWTYDTTGYQGASVETILDRVRRYTVPGTTIVMHLSNESTDTAALPRIISTLRGMGYGFTTPNRSVTSGAIGAKYSALGAGNSALRAPRTGQLTATTAGTGAVQWFQRGRIYWHRDTGAHEVHGAIMGKYAGLRTVNGFLRFPRTDERRCPDGVGRFNQFQGGSIYWSPAGGAHEVHGAILTRWASLGWEGGRLGYPVTDEYAVSGGRRSDFQHGSIIWTAATGTTRVVYG
ncbi:peptidoglycan/xylan/chitin deacetylase (PgdA/CDA1 family) [Prauserella muralis]|nr:peptidoglycan/xylan/chitin deacetylase (PgdA/CDA1 family) [Prauserella muralis]